MKSYCKDYIIKLLELQKMKLECINLGFNKSEDTKIEIALIKQCIEEMQTKK